MYFVFVSSQADFLCRMKNTIIFNAFRRPADTFDHADIVCSISDGQCDCLLVLLDQLDNLSLLQRSDPAADHCLTHARCLQELQLRAAFEGVGLRERGGNKRVQRLRI